MEEVVWFNGSLIPRSGAKLSPFDYGFLYGYGLFETMRAYNGIVFRLDDHLDRLLTSAKVLFIEHSYNKEHLTDAVKKLLEVNNLSKRFDKVTAVDSINFEVFKGEIFGLIVEKTVRTVIRAIKIVFLW
jgi:branched-subunit amino acid aminotransferase/4-amino-4-deoxychorismate lyase